MSSEIRLKSFAPPAVREGEILRYAGCRQADDSTRQLMQGCLLQALDLLSYQTVSCQLSLTVCGDLCDFGVFSVHSVALAKCLAGCQSVLLLAATVGMALDRLIRAESIRSPGAALMLQAIGAERVEALCDAFCSDYVREHGGILTPRFSPGYGDASLEMQREIFRVLKPEGRIGLYLNETLLMVPSKSVTALIGVKA